MDLANYLKLRGIAHRLHLQLATKPLSISRCTGPSHLPMIRAMEEWSERQDLNLRRLGPKPIISLFSVSFMAAYYCARLRLSIHDCPFKHWSLCVSACSRMQQNLCQAVSVCQNCVRLGLTGFCVRNVSGRTGTMSG